MPGMTRPLPHPPARPASLHSIFSVIFLASLLAGSTSAQESAAPAEPPAFTRLKSLEGHWRGQEPDGTPAWVSYRVLSDGTALEEELKMGSAPSMTSIYHADRDQVMMTHYCLTGTQPRLRSTEASGETSELTLEYVDATNVINATGGMMNGLRVRFIDGDHFDQLWNADPTDEKPVLVRYERVSERGGGLPVESGLVSGGITDSTEPSAPANLRALGRLAALAGEWEGTEETRGWKVGLTIKTVSGGTAVMENMHMGEGGGMVTVYHPDGDQLMLTHYCSSRSQSRMRTASIPPHLDRLAFGYVDATNVLLTTDAYMNNVDVELVDDDVGLELVNADQFIQTWNQDLADKDPIRLRYVRKDGGPDRISEPATDDETSAGAP